MCLWNSNQNKGTGRTYEKKISVVGMCVAVLTTFAHRYNNWYNQWRSHALGPRSKSFVVCESSCRTTYNACECSLLSPTWSFAIHSHIRRVLPSSSSSSLAMSKCINMSQTILKIEQLPELSNQGHENNSFFPICSWWWWWTWCERALVLSTRPGECLSPVVNCLLKW